MSRKNDAKSGKTDSKADNFALPKDWTAEDVQFMMESYLVGRIGGYHARSLSDALSLNTDLRQHMANYKLSVTGLIDRLTDNTRINSEDVKDILCVGRAVAVAKSFGVDLVKAECSLSACRSIGKKIPANPDKSDSVWMKRAFNAAIEGKDCRKHLPKRETKGKAEGESNTEGQSVHPATIGEILETLLARKLELTMEQLTSAVKSLAEEVRQRKAGEPVKASEPAAMAS